MINEYVPTEEVKTEIWKQLLINQVGYKKAMDLYDKVMTDFNPVEYAVQRAKETVEKRSKK